MSEPVSPAPGVAEPPAAPEIERVRLTDEQQRARRSRSLALAAVLVGLVVLFYVATVAKLGGNLVGIDAIRNW